MSSRTASVGLLHKSDGVIVAGWAGETMRCLTSCGVIPRSTQTLRIDSAVVGVHESTLSGS